MNKDTIEPIVALSDYLFKSKNKLANEIQKKLMTFITKFRADPTSSSINYEPIANAALKSYRSARVDDNYRCIINHPKAGNVYLLLWVDTHEEAYRWARTHVCNVNTQTGSIQVYQTVEASNEPVKTFVPPVIEKKPMVDLAPAFSQSDEQLLSIGVPTDRLALVHSVRTQEELDAIQDQLPMDAFEALVWLMEGQPWIEVHEAYAGESVQADDFERALKTDRNRYMFRVIDSDIALMEMMDAGLEEWRVFLHPTQRHIVDNNWHCPVLVRGGAGTGKTVVALHRAHHLVSLGDWKKTDRLLFTTFTKNLAVDIEQQLRKLCTPEQMKMIEVTNLDAWVAKFLKANDIDNKIVYPHANNDVTYDRSWKMALMMKDVDQNRSDRFYEEEWRQVVLPNNIQSCQEYMKISRKGMGTALSRAQRKEIWPVFEEMRLQLNQSQAITAEDAIFMAIEILSRKPEINRYRAVIVDETQDMGAESLQLLRTLAMNMEGTQMQGDLFMVGDGYQRIYSRVASLKACGINVRGARSRRLKVNYRTTDEIRKISQIVLEGHRFDDMDGEDEPKKGYRSLRHGHIPVTFVASSFEDEVNWLVERINELTDEQEDHYKKNEICVVTRSNELVTKYEKALNNRKIETCRIARQKGDNLSKLGVRLATMHRVKGLEFKIIFIVGAVKGQIPLKVSENGADSVDIARQDLMERALFHVAATRAKDVLFVSCDGKPGEYMSELIGK